MAERFKNLRGVLREGIMVPKDRIVERNAGCWSCTGFDRDKGKGFWLIRRQSDIEFGRQIALGSPKGEDDVRVMNIRKNIDDTDRLVAQGLLGQCSRGGETADGKPVGDLVHQGFMCHRYQAAQGASVARGGERINDLPEEILDKTDD